MENSLEKILHELFPVICVVYEEKRCRKCQGRGVVDAHDGKVFSSYSQERKGPKVRCTDCEGPGELFEEVLLEYTLEERVQRLEQVVASCVLKSRENETQKD